MQNSNESLSPVNTENVNNYKKFIFPIGVISVISLIILFIFYLFLSNLSKLQDANQQEKVTYTKSVSSSITPMPFAELTIPYLRKKTYDSKLAELEMLSNTTNYTNYLTNYTSDGLKVNGLLTKPLDDMPEGGYPAIVFTHGYIPPTSYQTTGEAYSSYVDYLAKSGFVVFKIDLRGHGESEGEAGGGYYGSDYVSDILHAYSALQNTDFVNPEKVGLWGHSMSGNAVLRSMAVKPDIPASVIWAGAVYTYVDMQKYRINDASYQPPVNNTERQAKRRELFEKHGSPSAESIFWRQVAPTNYLSDLKGAISLHHAVDDAVVNIGYSRDLDELLENTNVKHELYEYASGGHNISGASFTLAMQRTVEFFRKYL